MVEISDELISAVLDLETPMEVEEFLRGLLTPGELDQVVTRLEIVKRLKQGEAQRKIADDLGVGVATVTRGSAEIKRGRFKRIS